LTNIDARNAYHLLTTVQICVHTVNAEQPNRDSNPNPNTIPNFATKVHAVGSIELVAGFA